MEPYFEGEEAGVLWKYGRSTGEKKSKLGCDRNPGLLGCRRKRVRIEQKDEGMRRGGGVGGRGGENGTHFKPLRVF